MNERDELPALPLPVRASIYIAPDGTVHFGALFAELVPVAAALATSTWTSAAPTRTATATATTTPSSTPTPTG